MSDQSFCFDNHHVLICTKHFTWKHRWGDFGLTDVNLDVTYATQHFNAKVVTETYRRADDARFLAADASWRS
jgi:hypothetical protein